jgi:signal recognition particle subunit SRP54
VLEAAPLFETLSEKLQGVFRSLRGQGSLSEEQVGEALREIRLALLEADVHFKVVGNLLERVKERATGQEILKSLTPDQAVLRVLRDEMIATLGSGARPLELGSKIPAVVLMAGLQGSGKTTSAAKLALLLKKKDRHPLLVSTDVYRPAAREQLKTLAEQAGLHVHHPAQLQEPRAILESALAEARAVGHDVLIVDSAGRLHIDDELMAELSELRRVAQPSEVLYVADAMTGQDAVRSALEFETKIGVTGIVLTKLDGDARGGAALSVASVTGRPVKFAGVGETLPQFEAFQPERMVSRILGLGDVLSLIEKAEEAVDREKAEALVRKLRKSEFTLEDFRDQLLQVRRLGPLQQVLSMLPGVGSLKGVDTEAGERDMKRSLAIIDSMTARERREPSVLNGSRRKRIAKGSGTRVEDVNRLLKQYVQARKMMKDFAGGGGALRRIQARMAPAGRFH